LKLLTLIRHAKSSWKEPGRDDFDRPLNKRGERDSPRMGQRLARSGSVPELIVSSSARRAAETTREIAAQLGDGSVEVVLERELYLASPSRLLETVRALDPRVGHAALVAHNPGITDFLNALTGSCIDNVPTCGVARLRLDIEGWSEAAVDGAELVELDYPKRDSD